MGSTLSMFLMHRVELKASPDSQLGGNRQAFVPNAPCGVESLNTHAKDCLKATVPNAPCGVES